MRMSKPGFCALSSSAELKLTWQHRNRPLAFTPKVASQSASLVSSAAAFLLMPALFTAMCRPPSCSMTVSTILSHIAATT